MTLISDIKEFNFKDHPKVVEMYNRIIRDKTITRNGAIFEICFKNELTELEKVILAINLGEFKANELIQEQLKHIAKSTAEALKEQFHIPANFDINHLIESELEKQKEWQEDNS